MAGHVYSGENKLEKAGQQVPLDFDVTLRGQEHPWVSRGGLKLEKGLEADGALNVNHKCIFGKAGYTIGHFAAANRADLLVMNSPDSKLGIMDRVFTHELEYVLSDLPCCLMIVNQKEQTLA